MNFLTSCRRPSQVRLMMRKLAFVLGGVWAGGLAALLALADPPPQAQQAPRHRFDRRSRHQRHRCACKGPRQPIFFRHDIHAGQYKIQCQYCHYSVAVSPEPGIPSMQTCMGCHLVVSGSDSAQQDGDREGAEGLEREEADRVGAGSLHPPARALPASAAHQGPGAERLRHLPRRRRSGCRRSSRSTTWTRWASASPATSSGTCRGIARYVITERESVGVGRCVATPLPTADAY